MTGDGERPKLRLVGPDETVAEADESSPEDGRGDGSDVVGGREGRDDGGNWIGRAASAAPVLIGIAVLIVGLAVSLRLLWGDDGRSDASSEIRADDHTSSTAPGSTVDPRVLLPIETTSPPAGATGATGAATAGAPAPTAVAPSASASADPTDRSLVSVPLAGVPGAPPAPVPTTTPLPTTGTVRVRLFNGFLPGVALEVWDVASSPPVRYGTVGYGALAEIAAGGRLLPNGVELRLRFVRPGGDPLATSDPSAGPWQWNLTPADASAQTLVLVPNPGFRVVRIDDRRAARDTPAGRVHVVPVVFHLVIGGTRSLPWATDAGCLGPTSTDDVEPDLAPGTALRLANAGDASCSSTAAGPLTIGSPGPYAVVGLDDRAGAAGLVALPLG